MSEGGTIFDKIINGQIPCKKVYETEDVLAFEDINPQAPFHCLVIPKKFDGLSQISKSEAKHEAILGKLMIAVGEIARQYKLNENGFRVVINDGKDSGQTVFHLHIHILAGRELTWPPG